jgi:soluble lytic murein transglycosylase-like protein
VNGIAATGMAGLVARMAAIEARFGGSAPVGRIATPAPASAAGFESVLGSQLGRTARADGHGHGHAHAATPAGDFADLFASAGAAHGVDPALLAAVAEVESGLDPTAVSPAGAQGLMQLMPATAAELGVTDPFDPAQAVDGAARLLRGHLDRFGSVELALAAYNAGGGAVSRHGGIPPYPETQAYVRRVLEHYGATS